MPRFACHCIKDAELYKGGIPSRFGGRVSSILEVRTKIMVNSTDIYYSDDELLGEKIEGIPSRVYFAEGDKARLEVYNLSRQGYVFYNDLSTILNNDGGGMFGPIPAPPRTNLSNGALGFFQVSAVEKREINIE